MNKYKKYIEKLIAEKYSGSPWNMLGQCQVESLAMQKVFPELAVVRGFVSVMVPGSPGRRGHWWCVDPDGNIVDPTRGQFECVVLDYEPYKEGDHVRLGRCMNCGAEIWGEPEKGRQDVCSKSCEEILKYELGM